GDELLVLAVELLLVAGDLLVRAAELEAREVAVVEEDAVLAVNLLDHEVRDDVIVALGAVAETGLGVQLGDVVGCRLHVRGADAETLGDLAPPVRDELVETVANEPEGHRLLEPRVP